MRARTTRDNILPRDLHNTNTGTRANGSPSPTRLHSEASEKTIHERASVYVRHVHAHTHTSVARVRWQREGEREMPTRHGETETCTHDGGRSGWEGRGEAGAPVSAFQRRTSAPRLAHAYTHMRAHTYTRTTRHEHERDPCLTRLASVSSELSNGPVAFPALRASSPPFVIQSYVRTYVRTSVRTIDMCVTSSQPILIRRSFAVFAL